MSFVQSKISIISQAITLLGSGPITSIEGAGEFAAAAEQAYDLLLPSALSTGGWRFCTGIVQLSKLVDKPIITEWANAYQLPSNYLSMFRVYPRSPYDIYEDKLYSNSSEIKAEYRFMPDVRLLPSYFVDYFVLKLAKRLALSVPLKDSYAKIIGDDMEVQLAIARTTDAQAHPSNSTPLHPVIQVRF